MKIPKAAPIQNLAQYLPNLDSRTEQDNVLLGPQHNQALGSQSSQYNSVQQINNIEVDPSDGGRQSELISQQLINELEQNSRQDNLEELDNSNQNYAVQNSRVGGHF